MSINIIIAAVACITMVAAHSLDDSSDILSRNRRAEATSPPTKWMQELQQCCKNVPVLLKPDSMQGCNAGDYSCQLHCAYKKTDGMVTAADIIDYTAVGVRLAVLVAANKPWAAGLNGAYADCTAAPVPLVPENHNCKSGAAQLNYCMLRNSYMRCPVEAKNPSEECTKKLANIPNWGRVL